MGTMMLFWTAAACVLMWAGMWITIILLPTRSEQERQRKATVRRWARRVTWGLSIALAGALCAAAASGVKGWIRHRNEEEVKRVVKDAGVYELRLYTAPKAFNRSLLDPYWVPADQGGQTGLDVEDTIQGLVESRRYYGPESRSEGFEFLNVRLSGDHAEVDTRERWFMPFYNEDGSAVAGRSSQQTWTATYMLRKLNGRWLIQETTLPYKRRRRTTQ